MNDTMSELEWLLKDFQEKSGIKLCFTPCDAGEENVRYRGKPYAVTVAGEPVNERELALVRYVLWNAEAEPYANNDARLKDVLLDESSELGIFRFLTRNNIEDGACYALDVLCKNRTAEVASHIERCLEGSKDLSVVMDDSRIAVVKFAGDEQTPYEFGSFLSQSIYEELGVRACIGIGCEEKSFTRIAKSYQQAVDAVRMSGIFRSKGDVHMYREYLLVRMLEEVPKHRLKEYLEQFDVSHAEELFGDEEMSDTLEQFLECNLNASETSRNLYMHRNTLMYRLDKVESATGLDIRKFSDAVTFRVVTILYKLLHS